MPKLPNLLVDCPLRIIQGAVRNYDLFSYDVTVDENGVETGRVRSDLTGAVVTATFERADGSDLFTKVSSVAAEIEIHADQVAEATKGSMILKFVAADTSTLGVGEEIFWHVNVVYSVIPRTDRIIKRSRFFIER